MLFNTVQHRPTSRLAQLSKANRRARRYGPRSEFILMAEAIAAREERDRLERAYRVARAS